MKKEYVHSHGKWFANEPEAVIETLESDSRTGLSANEAQERLEEFGSNELPEPKRQSAFLRFIKHFNDILIYILFAAALITLILQHYADTIVIMAVAIINAAIGFFQESKAEKALAGIKSMLSSKAMVVRDGQQLEIEPQELTVGDIVLLEPGDKVPADLRLIKANNLSIEESALTGEAVPTNKHISPVPSDTALADRDNMAYSGTSVSTGTATGIVVAVGLETEIGHISQLLSDVETITTPLIRQMSSLSRSISIAILGISILVYLFGHFYREYANMELLLSVIGLAIAAIPEGLPAILSIILAIGVQNMAKRKAIVRNLPSVETLGAVRVICSDKTGTLTKNEMTVKKLAVSQRLFSVDGTGYAPKGAIREDGIPVEAGTVPLLSRLLHAFRVCNDADLKEENGLWTVQGDPTEGALIAAFEKSGLVAESLERIDELPFDSEHKYMAVLVSHEGKRVIIIKGAPDRLLEMAECQLGKEGRQPLDKELWGKAMKDMAAQGYRVLGAAFKEVGADKDSISREDLSNGIYFLGMAGIVDPPRDEVVDSIKSCHEAGISVKMITGDHIETAKAIGNELGIGDGSCAVSGIDLNNMTPDQMRKAVKRYDIFARTSPEHKLLLVKAIQGNGDICAMTGDGVNDAPALRRADVGVAMGIKGTEVTKDAAEIVLADDNFSTIVSAVEEGRRVFDNLKKTILFILPTNGAESFLIIASILFGTMIPLTPIQILWVNMVTSVTVSLALAFEVTEKGVMRRPPRPPKSRILSPYFLWRIAFVSILIGGLTLIMTSVLLATGQNEDVVRTTTLQTIAMCQLFHLFNSRSIRESAFCMNFFSNKAVFIVCALMIVLQLAVTYLPIMNRIFGTVPLGFMYWIIPMGLGVAVFFIVEAEKAVMRALDRRKKRTDRVGSTA